MSAEKTFWPSRSVSLVASSADIPTWAGVDSSTAWKSRTSDFSSWARAYPAVAARAAGAPPSTATRILPNNMLTSHLTRYPQLE